MFVSIAQLFYGQEKYTIQGEFPDNSLVGKYIILTDKSFLPDEYKRKWKASDDEVKILVTDKKFYYKGVTTRKPFFMTILSEPLMRPAYVKGPCVRVRIRDRN